MNWFFLMFVDWNRLFYQNFSFNQLQDEK